MSLTAIISGYHKFDVSPIFDQGRDGFAVVHWFRDGYETVAVSAMQFCKTREEAFGFLDVIDKAQQAGVDVTAKKFLYEHTEPHYRKLYGLAAE